MTAHTGRLQTIDGPARTQPPGPWPTRLERGDVSKSIERRFWSKVDKDGPLPAAWNSARDGGPCWLWMGATARGYGYFWRNGTAVSAHRLAYEWEHGAIPGDLVLDHLCRVKRCVNPAHLEAVGQAENVARGDAMRQRTSCRRGHEYAETGVYTYPDGRRECLACRHHRRPPAAKMADVLREDDDG